MPVIVVDLAFGQIRTARQQWLCPVQCLNLTLLVDTQDETFFGGLHVEADNIPDLLRKLRITTELEGFDPMRLKSVSIPDPIHGCVTHALRRCHCPSAPLRCRCRFRSQRCLYDLRFFLRRDRLTTATSGASSRIPSSPCSRYRSRHFM